MCKPLFAYCQLVSFAPISSAPPLAHKQPGQVCCCISAPASHDKRPLRVLGHPCFKRIILRVIYNFYKLVTWFDRLMQTKEHVMSLHFGSTTLFLHWIIRQHKWTVYSCLVTCTNAVKWDFKLSRDAQSNPCLVPARTNQTW